MNPTGMDRGESIRAGLLTAHLGRSGGGVYSSVRQFASALVNEPGIEVEVLGPADPSEDLSEWAPLSPRTARRVGPSFFSYAPGLGRSLQAAGLHLVHLHGLWMHPSMASRSFSRKTGLPHIVSPHGMLDPWALRNSGWKKRIASALFENANLESARCLHALNRAEETAIREYGLKNPVCVIPNGIDFPAEDLAAPALPWWAKAAPEVRTLLYLGRLHPKKGLPRLLAAWSLLDTSIRERWRLLIAGWEEQGHQTALRQMAAKYRIEDSITFPGPLFGEDKRAAYYHCDGFILPSLSEGLPVAVLEAWAAGKPVIMTPECNLPEGFQAEAAISIYPTEESIHAGLANFLTMEDSERKRMGANGLALARERYSWPSIAAEMAAVYRWVAGNGPKPPSVNLP